MLKELVYLTPTDTTMGFVSQNAGRLTEIKQRPPDKYYIKALPSLKNLASSTRVPEKYKNLVRRAKKTTFVFPDGHSYRVVREGKHHELIERLGWAYTTSANLSGEAFNEDFAVEMADVIVGFPCPHRSGSASRILKLNNIKCKRLR